MDQLTPQQRESYHTFYRVIEKLNQKADDLWPLDEDIDKRREIKTFIYQGIKNNKDFKTLFDELKDFALNLEVLHAEDINKYVICDDKIMKIF